MHEGKHGILDGVEDMDSLFGNEDEHDHEHDHDHEHGDHKHDHSHDEGKKKKGLFKKKK